MTPATIRSAIVAIIRGLFAPRRELASQVVPVEPRSASVLRRRDIHQWD